MTSHLQIKEQQQVEEIITLLKQTGDTGCFLFVTCAGPRARQTVEEAIREGLTRDTPVRTINLAAGERDLAARLRQELAVLKNSPPVYFIDGLPQVVSEEKAKGPGRLSHSLLQLNLSRDFFATKRLRLLLWLDEPTEQELFWKAGDLWAVRSGHWSFRHEADLKARITTEMEGRAPLFEAHDLRRRVEEDRELLYRYEKLRPDDRLGIAEARERLARSLIARGELEEAGSILTKSLGEIGEKNGSEWLAIRGESFLSLGHLHLLAGRFQESEAALRQSLAAFRRVGDSWGEANALRNLGVVQRRCGGDVVRAQAAVQKALTTFRRLGDPAGEAVTLADLGALYRVRGQLVHAEATLQDALAAFRRLGDPRGKASALGELAKVYRYRGELSRAEAALQETLATFHRVGDSWGEANALSELGIVYHDRGEFARAESMFDEALTIFRRVGDRCGEANVLGHLAAVHRDWGDLARAEAALKDAVAAFRGVGDSWGEARVLGDLALIHRDRGDYARAEAALKHTLATFRRFRDS
ncbi:MAG: tetratricopeptide repeat protein, partial [Acidobacteria bacterium]|nr:tetratricopeptide repeat protein [Acidobacteriota bacterium]